MKRIFTFFLILLVFTVDAYCYWEQDVLKQLEIFITYHDSNPSKALAAIKEASHLARKPDCHIDLDKENLIFYTCYIYAEANNGIDGNVKDYIRYASSYNDYVEHKWHLPKSYAMALMTADAVFKSMPYKKVSAHAEALVQAKLMLEGLTGPAQIESHLQGFFALSGFNAKVSEDYRQTLLSKLNAAIDTVSAVYWYDTAWNAMTDYDRYNYKEAIAIFCVKKCQEKQYPDAWAMQARLMERYSRLNKYWTDKKEDLYKKSHEAGGLWGTVGYARHLASTGLADEAFTMLDKVEKNPRFAYAGGALLMGEICEHGTASIKPDLYKAQQMYMLAAEKDFYNNQKQKAKKESDRLTKELEKLELEDFLASIENDSSPQDAYAAAVQLEALGQKDRAITYYEKAAQGNVLYAVTRMASHYYDIGVQKADQPTLYKALQFYIKAAETGHIPSIHNVALMQLYGLGTQADSTLAKQMFELYCEALNHKSDKDYYVLKDYKYIRQNITTASMQDLMTKDLTSFKIQDIESGDYFREALKSAEIANCKLSEAIAAHKQGDKTTAVRLVKVASKYRHPLAEAYSKMIK